MTGEIKALPTPDREQSKQAAIAVLEDYLERAKRGEIVSVAIAGVTVDLGCSTCWSKTDNSVALLGSVAVLNGRIVKGMVDY